MAASISFSHQAKEKEDLLRANQEQTELIKSLRTKPTVKATDDIIKAIESFRSLRRLGMLSDAEIVEKLFNWKG